MDTLKLTSELISRRLFREYLARNRWSLSDLAKRARISKSAVGHFSSGERTRCNAATATAIEDAFDVPRGTLFRDQVVRGVPTAPRPYERRTA